MLELENQSVGRQRNVRQCKEYLFHHTDRRQVGRSSQEVTVYKQNSRIVHRSHNTQIHLK